MKGKKHPRFSSFILHPSSFILIEWMRFDSPHCCERAVGFLLRREGDDALRRSERGDVSRHCAGFAEDYDGFCAQLLRGKDRRFSNRAPFPVRVMVVDEVPQAVF